jgi:glycosyltransferase involved in cell wall biosynthesis
MPTPETFDWHLLDARAIWVKELAAALARDVSLLGWIPRITWTGCLQKNECSSVNENPHLILREFPLQRGFARWPLRYLIPEGTRIADRLRQRSADASKTVLLCASPQYYLAAKHWPGPIIYYMSDLYYAWGDNPRYVNYFDRLICQRADLVCPVSARGKDYLVRHANCPEKKIDISPMATRAENILDAPLLSPALPPASIADLPRPLIGVIGNLAANTDWHFLQDAITRLPGYSWIFVGPTDMPVGDADHRAARTALMKQGGRVRFVGYQPYQELAAYARCLDVAVLPYRQREPTYSGSSTRFYEHLAACRPMAATRGFAELLEKKPLVHLVDSADELVDWIKQLEKMSFHDQLERQRWEASKQETWEARARAIRQELTVRIAGASGR